MSCEFTKYTFYAYDFTGWLEKLLDIMPFFTGLAMGVLATIIFKKLKK